MAYAATLLGSAFVTYFAHHYGEKFFTRNWTKKVRLIFKGYQIHHSAFGALAIVVALIISNIFATLILFGYGLGNIWQHKKTHNRFNQRGMVFISRMLSEKS